MKTAKKPVAAKAAKAAPRAGATAKWWLLRDMEFEPELARMAEGWITPKRRREMADLFASWANQLYASADRMDRQRKLIKLPWREAHLN